MFNKCELLLIIIDCDCPLRLWPLWRWSVAVGVCEGAGREKDGNRLHFWLRLLPRKGEEMGFFFPQPIYLPTHLPCRRVYEISIWRFAHLMPDFLVWKLGLDRRKECGGKACPQCFRSLGNEFSSDLKFLGLHNFLVKKKKVKREPFRY